MDESATFVVETPFAALAVVVLFALGCWIAGVACAKGQEMNQ
jgi:hypothetical protein